MIKADEVVPLLLAACPSFASVWASVENENVDDSGDRLHYVDAGAFAHHLVTLLKRDDVEGLRAAFGAIERMHLEGDAFVRELATIGYLEDVQNIAGWDGAVDPHDFEQFLGPETAKWWRGLNSAWSGETPLPVRPVD